MKFKEWFEKYRKILAMIFGILISLILIKEAMGTGDFRCYLNASEMLKDGLDPYADWIQIRGDNYCLYFYSPLWALLLIPFTYLNPFIPNILWLGLSIVFLARSWSLLLRYLNWSVLNHFQRNVIILLSFVMTVRFIQLDIALIQMTSFMLWVCLEALHAARNNRPLWSAAILALGINIKILPIVFIPYLLYRKRFKAAVLTMLFLLFYALLPAPFVGWDFNMELIGSWWHQVNPMKQQHLVETELGPHSLTAWIPTLLMESQGTLDRTRNIANLSLAQASAVLQVARFLLITAVLYFLHWPPFMHAQNDLKELRGLAYIFLLVPLIFPHQQKYAFVFILPAAVYLAHYLVMHWKNRRDTARRKFYFSTIVLVILAFVLMTMTTDGIIGRELNNITQHYKTITWGALMLIGALFTAQHQKQSRMF